MTIFLPSLFWYLQGCANLRSLLVQILLLYKGAEICAAKEKVV
jgi:hypothetical protein